MALSKAERDKLPATDFAVPDKRLLPIFDEKHVRMAWSSLVTTKDLTPIERHTARTSIMARAHDLKLDTTEWERGIAAQAQPLAVKFAIQAMSVSLAMPTGEHVNRMPFEGILTKLDQPSDKAPLGTGGRKISVSLDAAKRSLDSLLGMAVDYKPDFTGHNPQAKIGVITAASIEGTDLRVKGFIYAADFPVEAAAIQKDKDLLGFSFEAKEIYVSDPDSDTLDIQSLTFTGAAIMLKDRAAYMNTSLAAEGDEEEDSAMDPKLQEMLDGLTAGLKAVTDTVTGLASTVGKVVTVHAASHLSTVEPHCAALEASADKMEKAGIGLDDRRGHAVQLRRMAASMRAEAAVGKLPHAYHYDMYAAADPGKAPTTEATAFEAALKPITDSIAALTTKVADVAAAAAAKTAPPERKTLPPSITALLQKNGIEIKDGEKIPLATIDKVMAEAGIRGAKAIELKTALSHAKLID